MRQARESDREAEERRVYLSGVLSDTREFHRELLEQGLAHPADLSSAPVRERARKEQS